MPDAEHPMNSFMKGTMSLETIYDLLIEDFASDGKGNVEPDTTFFDIPPQGMGYDALSFKAFLNSYVNCADGKKRYNLAPNSSIYISQITAPKCVGNLTALIFAKQQ